MATKTISFEYQGSDSKGKPIKGVINQQNAALARAELRKQGVKVKKIAKQRQPLSLGNNRIGSEDIAQFTRQMATMMRAGVPLIKSFDIVANGLEKPKMRQLVLDIKERVSSGGTLADALRANDYYFDDLYCNLVESGEQSGALETMLSRIALYKEKSESLKKKIRKALTYPIVVLVFAVVVTIVLLWRVVPVFADMFQGFGADLPVLTQMVVNLSDWLAANILYLFVGIVGSLVAFFQAMRRSRSFRQSVQKLMVRLPIIGKLTRTAAIARYARTLSTTFAAGVPLVDALRSAAGASGNIVFSNAIDRVRADVESGTELNQSMNNQDLFPPMLVQMVTIGEEAGSLDDMLGRAANIYEEEVDSLVDGLTAMIEPFIMAFLAIVVGGLLISMYLPIFMMGSVI
ncbi:MAG: type II secretion system F family protein [Natronospirillum sp.]|uniref:type II secretion system F family protein n=1 Tax=Natronospirillum sp. TaxID=2812955 RepID=UPI0025DA5BB3|nr:type II secretion system F family protein [Natronospirillum sp.]MCH8551349.1 type II secretion system F family protein [Natronospirillum sp.]